MLPILIKIGDVEYNTGSLISGQPNGTDWEMVLDMVTMFVQDQAGDYKDGEYDYD